MAGSWSLLNVVVAGSHSEQRGHGDVLQHDERYEQSLAAVGLTALPLLGE